MPSAADHRRTRAGGAGGPRSAGNGDDPCQRARIALARGETKPAEAWASRALAIARRNPHGRSAEPLRTLGAVLVAEERFAEAEPVLAEALAQDRNQHGAGGADTARSLAQLANFYLRRGKAGDALPLIQEAAAIDQSRLGRPIPSSPTICTISASLRCAAP